MTATSSRQRTLLSWSSGKDSAWALHVLRQLPNIEVVGLLTTINEVAERVAMHAVRRELLEVQAQAAGLPLIAVNIPWPCNNAQYEAAMRGAMERARAEGVSHIAFGDLFLEDIRQYRVEKLAGMGIEPVFPLWGLETSALAREMIASGLKARLTCVDPKVVPREFAGADFTSTLLGQLPPTVDPCGERGEFHSFAYAGPMFERSIGIRTSSILERDGFVFADLQLAEG